MLINNLRSRLRRENGQILVLTAVVLPLMLLFTAFTIDTANVLLQHQSLQNAADAAAMATAQDLTVGQCSSSCASDAGTYAGFNGANPGSSNSSPLPACSTTAPIVSTNCYVAPYGTNQNQVEVLLQKSVPTFFGGVLGIHSLTISVRAVAGLIAGNAPPISFAALDNTCENHTLLVEAGGQLTVDNGIDDDSCSGDIADNNSSHDAFDVFAGTSAGNISAPSINVVGGWETHGSTVSVGGQVCALTSANSNTPASPGCPTVGASPTADPFANKVVSPTPASSGSCTAPPIITTPGYNPQVTLQSPVGASSSELAYAPSVTLQQNLTSGATMEAQYLPNPVNLHSNLTSGAPVVGAYSPNNVTLQQNLTSGAPLEAAFTPNVSLAASITATQTTVQVANSGATSAITVGNVIQIDNEQMLVGAVTANGSNWNLTVTRGSNGTTKAAHTATTTAAAFGTGAAAETLSTALSTTTTTFDITGGAGSGSIAVGQVIEIDSEQMTVTAVSAATGPPPPPANEQQVTVTRASNGTTAATHAVNAPVLLVSYTEPVYQIVPASTVVVSNSGATSSIAVGNVIQIDNEQMLVNSVVSAGGQDWDLSVTRGYNGTTEAAHTAGIAAPFGTGPAAETLSTALSTTTTTFDITGGAGSGSIAVGQVIEIDSEQMTVTAVSPATGGPPPPPGNEQQVTVTRASNGTTAATHALNAPVLLVSDTEPVDQVTPASTVVVSNAGATSSVAVGNVIQIDSEQMLVNTVTASGSNWNLSVTRGYNGTTEAAHTAAANEWVYQIVPASTVVVSNSGATSSIAVGNVIQIDNEQMLVNSVVSAGGQDWDLSVTRGYNGTTEAAHTAGIAAPFGTGPAAETLSTALSTTTTTFDITGGAGSGSIAVGQVIEIDSEQMTVTAVSPATGGPPPPPGNEQQVTVTRASNGTTAATHALNAPVLLVSDTEPVYQVISGSTIFVTNTGATSSISTGDVIEIDNEEMAVNTVTADGAQIWELSVTRAFNGTIAAAHATGAVVYKVVSTSQDGTSSSPVSCLVATGNVTLQPGTYYGGICIGGASGATNCTNSGGPPSQTNCVAAGGTGSNVAPFGTGPAAETLTTPITTATVTPNITFDATGGGPSGSIAVGQVLEIDSEEMTVTAVAPATGGPPAPPANEQAVTVSRGTNSTEASTHAANAPILLVSIGTAFAPAENLSTALTTTTTTFDITGGGPSGSIAVGQVIGIDSEEMVVTAVTAATGGPPAPPANEQQVTVTRAANSTTAATHALNAAVVLVSTAASGSAPTVTLAPGTYIMAGGGFSVCGSANLIAPNVMIYNTDDPSDTSGNGALGQVDLNTSGSVDLGPQTSGPYQGLTIFQDPNLTLDSTDSCDAKHTNSDDWDIALQSMAPVSPSTSSASGALGSISGTIYAPAYRADFADVVSGIANLAVLTSCIYIDGVNSTYDYQSSGLFGVSYGMTG